LVRKRGTICLFASLPVEKSTLALDSRLIHYNELRVTGSSDSTPAQVAKAVALLAVADFPADRLVTHVLPFEGFMGAIGLMERGEALRVVLTP
jgi:L-iditol 2-dehydrogenase